jgi:NAD(P)-dependent dehydrogenase (short-subunit alcohol dehydrogenase family)
MKLRRRPRSRSPVGRGPCLFKSRPTASHSNCVAPGRVNTAQVLNRLFRTEDIRRGEIELNAPAGRFGETEEIAAVVTFLASARASYVTGTMVAVDGGMQRLDLK